MTTSPVATMLSTLLSLVKLTVISWQVMWKLVPTTTTLPVKDGDVRDLVGVQFVRGDDRAAGRRRRLGVGVIGGLGRQRAPGHEQDHGKRSNEMERRFHLVSELGAERGGIGIGIGAGRVEQGGRRCVRAGRQTGGGHGWHGRGVLEPAGAPVAGVELTIEMLEDDLHVGAQEIFLRLQVEVAVLRGGVHVGALDLHGILRAHLLFGDVEVGLGRGDGRGDALPLS